MLKVRNFCLALAIMAGSLGQLQAGKAHAPTGFFLQGSWFGGLGAFNPFGNPFHLYGDLSGTQKSWCWLAGGAATVSLVGYLWYRYKWKPSVRPFPDNSNGGIGVGDGAPNGLPLIMPSKPPKPSKPSKPAAIMPVKEDAEEKHKSQEVEERSRVERLLSELDGIRTVWNLTHCNLVSSDPPVRRLKDALPAVTSAPCKKMLAQGYNDMLLRIVRDFTVKRSADPKSALSQYPDLTGAEQDIVRGNQQLILSLDDNLVEFCNESKLEADLDFCINLFPKACFGEKPNADELLGMKSWLKGCSVIEFLGENSVGVRTFITNFEYAVDTCLDRFALYVRTLLLRDASLALYARIRKRLSSHIDSGKRFGPLLQRKIFEGISLTSRQLDESLKASGNKMSIYVLALEILTYKYERAVYELEVTIPEVPSPSDWEVAVDRREDITDGLLKSLFAVIDSNRCADEPDAYAYLARSGGKAAAGIVAHDRRILETLKRRLGRYVQQQHSSVLLTILPNDNKANK